MATEKTIPGVLYDGSPPAGVRFAMADVPNLTDWTLERSVEAQFSMTTDKLTMDRAFPTCALYIVDDNKDIYHHRQVRQTLQTHYYDITDWLVNARYVSQKENPADLLILTLENSDGYLTGDGGYFGQQADQSTYNPLEERDYNAVEDFSNGGFVRSGLTVEFRLGYDANPNALDIVFSGVITSVFGEDFCTVECQGHGVELVSGVCSSPSAEGKIYDEEWWAEASTENILFTFLVGGDAESKTRWGKKMLFWFQEPFPDEPENFLSHFGKYYVANSAKNIAEDTNVEELYRYSLGYGDRTLQNIYLPREDEDRWTRAMKDQRFVIFPFLQEGGWVNPTDLRFTSRGMNFWQVLKTLELRYPGYITTVRNYPSLYGSEATLFFGPSWAPYVYRDGNTYQSATNFVVLGEDETTEKAAIVKDLTVAQQVDAVKDNLVLKIPPEGCIKPLKQYHLVTSTNDIITNNIRISTEDGYNAVRINYEKGYAYADGFRQLKGGSENIASRVIKLSETIKGSDTHILDIDEPNAVNDAGARRMGISYLIQLVKEYYQGELVIIGDPKIKVYDTIILIDDYMGMYGCFDVGEVEHVIDADIGFITKIKPDMCVSSEADSAGAAMNMAMTNMYREMGINYTLFDIMNNPHAYGSEGPGKYKKRLIVSGLLSEDLGLFGNVAAFGPIGGLTFLAAYSWGQYNALMLGKYETRNPVIIQPLILNNEPYIMGLYGYSRPTQDLWEYTKEGWRHGQLTFTEYLRYRIGS